MIFSERLNLEKVTAICIDGRAHDPDRDARYRLILEYMTSRVKFGAVKLLTPCYSSIPEIESILIEPMSTLDDYSKFCLHQLYDYVDTEYCLVFQDDGFIIHPENWDDRFYQYDYIGAPWPNHGLWPNVGDPNGRVGNGGFSLRSKRLLSLTRQFTVDQNEDIIISSTQRSVIDSMGLLIAPMSIAKKFSIEAQAADDQTPESCFGFHHKLRMDDSLELIRQKLLQNLY